MWASFFLFLNISNSSLILDNIFYACYNYLELEINCKNQNIYYIRSNYDE